METKINYAAVGLFVTVLSTVLIVIGIWLSVGMSHKTYLTYVVFMKESVSGLNVDAPVKYNGVIVGKVSDIFLNPRNPQEVELYLEIEEGTPITQSTTATLSVQGLTGIAFLALNPGQAGSPPLRRRPGERYPVIKSAPSLLARLDYTVGELMRNLNSLSQSMRSIFDEENQRAIKHIFLNLDKITGTIAINHKHIGDTLRSTAIFMKNAADASEKFPEATESFSHAMDSGSSLMTDINDQTLPDANSTLEHLRALSEQLQIFTNDLNQNPSMLIRGRTPPQPGPGE